MMDIDEDIAELARGGPAPGGFFDTDNPEEVDKQSEFVLNQLPKIDTF